MLLRIRLSDAACGDDDEEAPIFVLDGKLRAALHATGLGEMDGHEWGGGYFTSYMYGPDADRLFEAVAAIILTFPARRGSYVVKRYGAVGAATRLVDL